MTSEGDSRYPVVLEDRRRSPLDQLPPPANSNKPLTPFSIEDILSRPSARRSGSGTGLALLGSTGDKLLSAGLSRSGRPVINHTSPLCALEELASKTFRGLEVSVLQAAEGRDGGTLFGQRSTPKKRRKSRTAFTNQQIYELEKRFLYQKYLSPADRDQIAQQLGLTNAQVITWFQNRRAKLKRDLEEMKADVDSARVVGTEALEKLSKLAELEKCAAGVSEPGHPLPGRREQGRPEPGHPAKGQQEPGYPAPGQMDLDSSTETSSRPQPGPPSPGSPGSPWPTDRRSLTRCSEDEDEDEEIDVDD